MNICFLPWTRQKRWTAFHPADPGTFNVTRRAVSRQSLVNVLRRLLRAYKFRLHVAVTVDVLNCYDLTRATVCHCWFYFVLFAIKAPKIASGWLNRSPVARGGEHFTLTTVCFGCFLMLCLAVRCKLLINAHGNRRWHVDATSWNSALLGLSQS
jgi:hypothetical protein